MYPSLSKFVIDSWFRSERLATKQEILTVDIATENRKIQGTIQDSHLFLPITLIFLWDVSAHANSSYFLALKLLT
jgi:hypothetical protein